MKLHGTHRVKLRFTASMVHHPKLLTFLHLQLMTTTNTNDFFPSDYEHVPASASNGQYLNPSKLEKDKETLLRVVTKPIIGYSYWNSKNKPVRTKEHPGNPSDIQIRDGKPDSVKIFWAMIVYNYTEQKIQILELTQKSIMDAIHAYVADEDYGSPLQYDLKLKKTGDGIETRYELMAKPPKDASEEVLTACMEVKDKINLDALYDGTDPFQK